MTSHRIAGLVLAGSALAGLAGCASPYAANSLFGGYNETQLDASHWRVKYDGNGHTSKERVWTFWLHRCAELSKEKGYAYFTLAKDWQKPAAPATAPVAWRRGNGTSTQSARSAAWRDDGSAPSTRTHDVGYVVIPTYSPGYSIQTWHTDAVVTMFNAPLAAQDAPLVLSAQAVLDDLGPYVRSNGESKVTPRDDVMRHALRWVDAQGRPSAFIAVPSPAAPASPKPAPAALRPAAAVHRSQAA